MTTREFSDILLRYYSVRHFPNQKEAFIHFAAKQYSVQAPVLLERKHRFGFSCTNMVFGDPAQADAIVAAYYDTPKRCFFPYRRYYGNPLAQFLQIAIPLVLLFCICWFIVRLFHWACFFSLLLFLPLALAACCAFANPVNANYSSGLVALHAFCRQYSGNLCVVLLDNSAFFPSGKRFFQKKYRQVLREKPFLLFHLTGSGTTPLIAATLPMLISLPDFHIPLYKKVGKRPRAEISMVQHSNLGYHSGPLCTPDDDTLYVSACQQAADIAAGVLHTFQSKTTHESQY